MKIRVLVEKTVTYRQIMTVPKTNETDRQFKLRVEKGLPGADWSCSQECDATYKVVDTMPVYPDITVEEANGTD